MCYSLNNNADYVNNPINTRTGRGFPTSRPSTLQYRCPTFAGRTSTLPVILGRDKDMKSNSTVQVL